MGQRRYNKKLPMNHRWVRAAGQRLFLAIRRTERENGHSFC